MCSTADTRLVALTSLALPLLLLLLCCRAGWLKIVEKQVGFRAERVRLTIDRVHEHLQIRYLAAGQCVGAQQVLVEDLVEAQRVSWQRRYWEHTITTELDYSRHIGYIHVNSLKHGYVTRVQDWPYSTSYQYVHDGILAADWCSDVGDLPTVSD